MQILFENNFFDLFGIEKAYSLDRQLLRDRFRDLQKKFHPDNFASATEQDRLVSVQYAALINEAFATLDDPVQRGRYMLSLDGISTDEELDTQMDPEFLMQQIELREELDAARSSSLDALNRLSDKVESDFSARMARVGEILDGADDSELDRARHLVRELQFLSRVRREIEEVEESFY
ncbi:MAG: Fe-S protein assembly co-chaperone HscB [Gammaproteobacteria bacterium]|nr:Fe-S protein assembly co-chaperone HscB [Gammaproteobacteria bacterium]